jgi:hypothetical protein
MKKQSKLSVCGRTTNSWTEQKAEEWAVMSNMENTEIWHKIGHLFKADDGSLPDIFVVNLTDEQIVTVYTWVVSEAGIYGEPTLWSIKEERDILIKEIDNPAQKFIENEVEIFRHGLNDLK